MDRRKRLKVAILFGGQSEEHDVSVKSAAEIAANIDTGKYDPLYIGITRAGLWKTCGWPCAGWENGGSMAALLPDRGMRGLLVMDGHGRRRECGIIPVDVAFPVIHGKTGEDGAMQGLLELSGIPYVGCGIQSSAVCMDKSLAYIAARAAGIATPDFLAVEGGDAPAADALAYPVFVKPARSGSSFGVKKVACADELAPAIEMARQYDSKVLIEQAVAGCEAGCAILGNGADLVAGEVDQIKLRHGFFRIHQEAEPENGSENAEICVPADLPGKERGRIKETAKKIYAALGCSGLARVDMFMQDDGRIVLNEVNTMPGFTSYSRYPRMMAAAGIALPELIDRLITLAAERWRHQG
ncbi:MAG: D-alanine--(R)-lactate ligase [Clostridiales Family XIII bacterium]|jgi:D-alanine--(R)-lactate ligase|nr:D-alanine--(R)-lactate ligase [Clostridiales Family XIII bacterium]